MYKFNDMKIFRFILITLFAFISLETMAQMTTNVQQRVSINDTGIHPDSSAILDLADSNKGVLLPTMTSAERDSIENPADGLLIYNKTDSCFNYYAGDQWVKDCGLALDTDPRALQALRLGGTKGHLRAVDSDDLENYYVAGYFSESLNVGDSSWEAGQSTDVILVKYNRHGTPLWYRRGSGEGYNASETVTVDTDGNVIISGYFSNAFSFLDTITSNTNGPRIFVAKINSTGNPIWFFHQNGLTNDNASTRDVQTDATGNIYVVGHFEGDLMLGDTMISNTADGKDGFLAKLSPGGHLIWLNHLGGPSDDWLEDLAVDSQGDVIVSGHFMDSLYAADTFFSSVGQKDLIFLKFNTDGQFLWGRSGGGPYDDFANAVETDPDDHILLAGQFSFSATLGDSVLNSNGDEDIFLAKFDSYGHMIWSHSEGGYSSDDAQSISVDEDGNTYLTGSFVGFVTIGGEALLHAGGDDVLILKYNSGGTIEWVRSAGGSHDEKGMEIDVNRAGVLSIVGDYKSTPSFGGRELTSPLFNDGYFVQYSVLGDIQVPDSRRSNMHDPDSDPINELITNTSIDGFILEITEGESSSLIDLSALPFTESDPQVSFNFFNSISKWDGSALTSSQIHDKNTSRMGISTTNPSGQFSLGGLNHGFSGSSIQLHLAGTHNNGVNQGSSNGTIKLLIEGHDNDDSEITYPLFVKDEDLQTDLYLKGRVSSTALPHLYMAGYTSIVTDSFAPAYRLAVKGLIMCEGITELPIANWPDYVFDPNYELPALHDIKTFIDKHGHLPGVPSENDIAKNGLVLGEAARVVLEKIEELTLHVLRQEELFARRDKQFVESTDERKNQQKIVVEQQTKVEDLMQRISQLESTRSGY
jgi:hypothetical protein